MIEADGLTTLDVNKDDPDNWILTMKLNVAQYARYVIANRSASSPGSDSHGSFSGLVTHAEAAGVSQREEQ